MKWFLFWGDFFRFKEGADGDDMKPQTTSTVPKTAPSTVTSEDGTVHFYEDGHYWTEMAGIPPEDQIPSYEHSYVLNPEYKKRVIRVRFSADPIRGIHSFSHYCLITT